MDGPSHAIVSPTTFVHDSDNLNWKAAIKSITHETMDHMDKWSSNYLRTKTAD